MKIANLVGALMCTPAALVLWLVVIGCLLHPGKWDQDVAWGWCMMLILAVGITGGAAYNIGILLGLSP